MGRLGLGPRLVGRMGSEIRVNANLKKNARLVGRLGSGPRLMADRVGVVPANKKVRLTLLAGRQDRQGRCNVYPRPILCIKSGDRTFLDFH